jgi:L-fucose isomerase-like protein
MKETINVGLVCLARKTFDSEAALASYRLLVKELQQLEEVRLKVVTELIIEVDEARRTARKLATEALDGLICVSGTFHLGHLVLELHKQVQKPLLLRALPELPYQGGKIRLNSLCGLNLDASNLYKSGVGNYSADLDGETLAPWLDALRVIRALKRAHIGLVGARAMGFFNVDVYDPTLYGQTGVLLDHYELAELTGRQVEPRAVKARSEQIRSIFDVSGISAEQLAKVAGLAARLDSFLEEHGLSALSIRCWPEFAATYGVSPCAAMSLLQAEGKVLACEGDVDGAVSMLAQAAVGAETPFLFDFSQANFQEDFALLWHCGVAPCNLWDGRCVRSLDTYFAGGKGVTADFVLKEGPISVLRLDSCGGNYRVFLARGEARAMEKELKGTYAKAVFDVPIKKLFTRVVENGLAHHASAVYGDFLKPFEILARIKNWELIR